MAISRVQHRENDASTTLNNVTSGTISFSSAVTAGSVIYLAVRIVSNTVTITPSMTGVTWTQVGSAQVISANSTLQIWRGVVNTGGATNITITFTAAVASNTRFRITEWGGLDTTATPTAATASGTSATQTSGTVTPTAGAHVLILGENIAQTGTQNSAGAPWTDAEGPGTGVWAGAYQDVASASGSAYSIPFTGSTSIAFVNKILYHAAAAVVNNPPTASITAPANNSHFATGATINFTGTGSDTEDGTLTGASLVWTSSRDGLLGTGTSLSTSGLSNGTHTITLTATDSGALTGTATIIITVGPPALVYGQAPTSTQQTGVAITPAVTVQRTSDGYTPINTAGVTITLSIASGTGTVEHNTATTNASGLATFPTFDILGTGTFTVTASDGAGVCASVTSSSFIVANLVLVTIATPPANITVGGITGAVCPKYLRYLPAAYDGSVAYPVIMHWHGSTDEWTGATPGNMGVQVAGSGASGLGDAVLDMTGQTSYAVGHLGAIAAVEGDWPAIIVFPQYGNAAKWTTGNNLQKQGWAESAKVLWDAIIADLVAAGYNIDTSRLYVSGVSGGAQVMFYIMLHDVLDNPTYHVAAALGGAAQIDVRGVNQISGRTDSGTHVVNTTTVHYVASQLKNIPICVTAGQDEQENSIVVDSNFDQASSTRDLANAFHNPSDVGTPIPDLYWYIEYRANGTSGTNHVPNYTWPYYTTAIRNWLFAQSRNPVTPNFERQTAVQLTQVPHLSADPVDVVTYEFTLDAVADNLPGLRSTAYAGGVMRRSDAGDLAVYADSAHTRRLRALRLQHNLANGKARYAVGMPRGSALNLNPGPIVYVAYGASNVAHDLCVDGHLAYDYRISHAVDFGDGTSVTITNAASVLFPDKITLNATQRDDFVLTGAPTAVTSPLGGGVACKSTSKYITNHRPEWRVKSGDTTNTHSVPSFLAVFARPNGTVAADQCLVALQSSSVTARTTALVQGASNSVKLKHGTIVVTSAVALNPSAYNFLAYSMAGLAQRSLYVNPADGNAADTNTTNNTVLGAANQMQIGFCQASSIIENANTDLAKIWVGASRDTPQSTPGVPNADWFTAMDWAARGKSVAYTVGAEVDLTTPPRYLPVNAVRFIAGTGATKCYMGLPLRPGMLTVAQFNAGYGRLVFSGSEVQTFLEPPTGPGAYNGDGSMQCIYVQCTRTLTKGTPVAGQFQYDTLRTLSLLTLDDPVPFLNAPSNTGPGSENYESYYVVQGAIVPANAVDICDSGVLGYVRPTTDNPTDGSAFAATAAAYDTEFAATEPTAGKVTSFNSAGFEGYYDRLFAYLQQWARTGNPLYLQRGFAQYARMRTDYWAPNNWGTSEYNLGVRGFALAYWLFRDLDARDVGLFTEANRILGTFWVNLPESSTVGSAWNGERKRANHIRILAYAIMTGCTGLATTRTPLAAVKRMLSDPSYMTDPSTTEQYFGPTQNERGSAFSMSSRQYLRRASDLVWDFGTLPFQAQQMCDALMAFYDHVAQDAEIVSRIQATADAWWAMRYPPGTDAAKPLRSTCFPFASITYNNGGSGSGGTGSAIDLNQFAIWVYYWLAWRLASQTYLDHGDELFAAAVVTPYDGDHGPYTGGATGSYKQWAENFMNSPQNFGLRQLAVAAIAAGGGGGGGGGGGTTTTATLLMVRAAHMD